MEAVFIGGCERSGTTLLGSLLGSHTQCIATPESHFKIEPMLSGVRGREGRLDPGVLAALRNDVQFRIWNVDLRESEWTALDGKDSIEEVLYAVARAYGRKTDRDGSARFWIDHTPSNIMYVSRLQRHFRGSRFLHVIRDGRAVSASLLRVSFGPNTIKACADHWRGRVASGLAAESALPAESVARVHYEDLINDPEGELRRLCDFLGIEFQPSMATGGGFRPESFGRKVNRLVGQAPVKERLTAWQGTLSRREIEIFEALTGDLLPCLGYDLLSDEIRGPSWPEKFIMDLREISGRVYHASTYRWSQRRHAPPAKTESPT